MEREEQDELNKKPIAENEGSALLKQKLEAYLLDALENGEKVSKNPDGTYERDVGVSAALLGVIRQYIKDFPPNFIPSPGEAQGVLKRYAKELPFGDK